MKKTQLFSRLKLGANLGPSAFFVLINDARSNSDGTCLRSPFTSRLTRNCLRAGQRESIFRWERRTFGHFWCCPTRTGLLYRERTGFSFLRRRLSMTTLLGSLGLDGLFSDKNKNSSRIFISYRRDDARGMPVVWPMTSKCSSARVVDVLRPEFSDRIAFLMVDFTSPEGRQFAPLRRAWNDPGFLRWTRKPSRPTIRCADCRRSALADSSELSPLTSFNWK